MHPFAFALNFKRKTQHCCQLTYHVFPLLSFTDRWEYSLH